MGNEINTHKHTIILFFFCMYNNLIRVLIVKMKLNKHPKIKIIYFIYLLI